jgi:hypothetical protein
MGIPGSIQGFPEIWKISGSNWTALGRRKHAVVRAVFCGSIAIRLACTTLFDHHASPEFIDGSLDVIADVIDKSGLSASLCYESYRPKTGKENGTKAVLRENVRF